MLTGDPHRVLNQIGVPIAKVNTVNDVLNEPLFYNDFAHAKDPRTSIEVALSPIAEVSADRLSELSFPPRLGEHNASIYDEVLGNSRGQLADLRNRQVI